MADTVVEALILDLLEWVANAEKSYEEVMDAWRTSCPRLPVWEDANDRGLVVRQQANGRCVVRVTELGHDLLQQRRSLQAARHAGHAINSDNPIDD
jgi:predicted transcriptional regulator